MIDTMYSLLETIILYLLAFIYKKKNFNFRIMIEYTFLDIIYLFY